MKGLDFPSFQIAYFGGAMGPAGVAGRLIDWTVRAARPRWGRALPDILASRFERFAPLGRIDLPEGRRLVVVAPHPDDESIGCGGLVALWASAGREAGVVFLTEGESGAAELRDPALPAAERDALRCELRARRRAEAEAALSLLGAAGVWLDGADGALYRDEGRLAARLAEHWRAHPPDLIAAPDPGDRHADHAVAARIVAGAAARALPMTTPVLAYEVWSPAPVNVVLDITGVEEIKWRAIASHRSQTSTTDYVGAASALNRYRAITAGQPDGHAEGFRRTTAKGYAEIAERLRV
jgi:LmbE family N-acetylglucosaminyl deacetylase